MANLADAYLTYNKPLALLHYKTISQLDSFHESVDYARRQIKKLVAMGVKEPSTEEDKLMNQPRGLLNSKKKSPSSGRSSKQSMTGSGKETSTGNKSKSRSCSRSSKDLNQADKEKMNTEARKRAISAIRGLYGNEQSEEMNPRFESDNDEDDESLDLATSSRSPSLELVTPTKGRPISPMKVTPVRAF